MKRSKRFGRITGVLASCAALLFFIGDARAQSDSRQDASPVRTTPVGGTVGERAASLSPNVDPFTEIDRVSGSEASQTFDLNLKATPLDPAAKATATAVLRDRTLLVRMRARDIPPPSTFGVPRYALWAYLPNYDIKLYIGDLPVVSSKKGRGESDTAFRYTVLPRGATFGGLMLTAEPVRYEPIVNEALRPVLVGLTPQADVQLATAAPALYGVRLPDDVTNRQDIDNYLAGLRKTSAHAHSRPDDRQRRQASARRALVYARR